MCLIVLAFVFLPPQFTHASVGSITRIKTGLVAQDTLTTGNLQYWTLGGGAVWQGAPHTYSEDSQGLHIGIQAAQEGSWVGFYAVSPSTDAQVFHAVLTLPTSSLASDQFNTGLYVQTSSGNINYITCAAQAESSGYHWSVVYATGDSFQALSYTNLFYQSGGANAPLTRDCTIVTNGQNFLQVYLDGTLVYGSDTLNLQIPPPFNAYLEVETTYATSMLFGTYNDYYATTSDIVQVQNAPAGYTAELVDSNNNLLASATVGSDGVALLGVGQYHMPISGYVQIYDSSHNLVATTAQSSIWGGDAYQVNSLSTATSTTSTSSTATTSSISTTSSSSTTTATTTTASSTSIRSSTSSSSSSSTSSTTTTATTTASTTGGTASVTVNTEDTTKTTITGYYTVLYQNGNILSTGFSPATFTLNKGQTYTVQVDDYGSCNFAYWLDTGSTNSQRSISVTSDSSVTAVYNCGSPTQSSGVTVKSVNQNGAQIDGYYTVLFQYGNTINTGFTTITFPTISGEIYTVQVDDYASCSFSHWQDSGSSNSQREFTATSSGQMFTAVYTCT